jgi:hypothetical protein
VTAVRVTFLMIGALGILNPTAVRADTARETLEQFGFFGTWAVHCDEPASPENVTRHALASTKSRPSFTETLGKDSQPNIYSVLGAKRVGDDTIIIRTKLNNDIEQDLTIRKDQNRVRTVQNREVGTGDLVVKDGIVDSNKSETPWLTRCSDEPPSR